MSDFALDMIIKKRYILINQAMNFLIGANSNVGISW